MSQLRLVQFKAQNMSDETVTDDIAGKAFVEQFALQTFSRADNTVRANKVTKQTADTFQAAATFMELLAIWGAIEPDIQQKIKFAKFHALRIVKALKAGEDPNLSNPKQEPEPEQIMPPLDPSDPEVQALTGGSAARQPSVADAPDESDYIQAKSAKQSYLNESIHPSRVPSTAPEDKSRSGAVSPLPQDAANFYSNNQAAVSPVSPERASSVGGNYFPRMPSPTAGGSLPDIPPTIPSAPMAQDGDLDLPSAPDTDAAAPVHAFLPSAPGGTETPLSPASTSTFMDTHSQAPPTPLDSFQAPPTPGPPPISSPQPRAQQPYQPPSIPAPQTAPVQSWAQQPSVNRAVGARNVPAPAPQPQPVEIDEEAVMKAQKHGRWAISALNFEDVPTAIREFEAALRTLGAR